MFSCGNERWLRIAGRSMSAWPDGAGETGPRRQLGAAHLIGLNSLIGQRTPIDDRRSIKLARRVRGADRGSMACVQVENHRRANTDADHAPNIAIWNQKPPLRRCCDIMHQRERALHKGRCRSGRGDARLHISGDISHIILSLAVPASPFTADCRRIDPTQRNASTQRGIVVSTKDWLTRPSAFRYTFSCAFRPRPREDEGK